MDRRESIDGRLERAKDSALGAHRGNPSTADEIGEAAGGISGALLGAGVGSAVGPLGTLLGGIAGALGGWWAGRAVSEAAERFTIDDDEYYRRHFAKTKASVDRRYEDVREAYFLGQVASHNPNFVENQFEAVEGELERAWAPVNKNGLPWRSVRPFAEEGFVRGIERRQSPRPDDARR